MKQPNTHRDLDLPHLASERVRESFASTPFAHDWGLDFSPKPGQPYLTPAETDTLGQEGSIPGSQIKLRAPKTPQFEDPDPDPDPNPKEKDKITAYIYMAFSAIMAGVTIMSVTISNRSILTQKENQQARKNAQKWAETNIMQTSHAQVDCSFRPISWISKETSCLVVERVPIKAGTPMFTTREHHLICSSSDDIPRCRPNKENTEKHRT